MSSNPAIKPDVIIVEDNLIFRQVLKSLISVEKLARVIGEASNGLELLDLLLQLHPDLILMDIDMPEMNGIDATQKALELYPDLKIIALTQYGEEEYYNKMVALGARGFILKSKGIWELEKAIKEVMKGKKYFSENIMVKTGKTKGFKSTTKSAVKAKN
jgi:DNA-binding NarL/FixJ family response regulator